MDRRRTPRVFIKLRSHVIVNGHENWHDVGATENISRTGVLCRLPAGTNLLECLTLGQFVETDIELPWEPGSPRRSLYCRGVVTWVSKDENEEVLFGLALNQMEFRDLPHWCMPEPGKAAESQLPVVM